MKPQGLSQTLGGLCPTLTRAPLSLQCKPDQPGFQSQYHDQRWPRQASQKHCGADSRTENNQSRNQQPAKDAGACIFEFT